MIKEIRFSEEFDRAFKRLKKRYRSLPDDVKKLLASLVENPEQGVELHNGLRKVRISFASKGHGKRGGGRVIIQLAVTEDCLTFVYIYDKSGKLTGVVANIACPAQIMEQRSVISADYWGKVKILLREKHGADFKLLGLVSPAGDQCPRDLIR